MIEDFLISEVVDELKPFVKHTLYTLAKASMDTLLSLDKAAEEMGVNRATLKKRCQRGSFPCQVVDGVYYISKLDMNLFIKGGPEEFAQFNKDYHKQLKKGNKK